MVLGTSRDVAPNEDADTLVLIFEQLGHLAGIHLPYACHLILDFLSVFFSETEFICPLI